MGTRKVTEIRDWSPDQSQGISSCSLLSGWPSSGPVKGLILWQILKVYVISVNTKERGYKQKESMWPAQLLPTQAKVISRDLHLKCLPRQPPQPILQGSAARLGLTHWAVWLRSRQQWPDFGHVMALQAAGAGSR